MPTLERKYLKIGRNEKCPCHSGKKFKHCCGPKPQQHDQFTINKKQISKFFAMKEEILNYLQTDRSFDAGFKLYRKYGRNNAFIRKFNLQGDNPKNLEFLHFQLFKLTGLPTRQFDQMMVAEIEDAPATASPVTSKESPAPEPVEGVEGVEGTDGPGKPKTALEAVKFKLRDEFPFLSSKLCPDSLKVLVADMMTAYENYTRAHEELYNVTDENEAFAAADKLIENYLDNRAIWKELNHFKNTGTILGEHAYFAAQKRRGDLMKKSVPELIKLKEQLEMNIWRNKKKMDDDPKPHLLKQRQERIAGYETDLQIVKSLLNIE